MLNAATATMPPTIIRDTFCSILKAPNLEGMKFLVYLREKNELLKLKDYFKFNKDSLGTRR